MNAPQFNGAPGDDDPDGDQIDRQCPGCPARDGERCEPGCTCGSCELTDDDGEAFRGGEAAAYEREQQAELLVTLK